MQYDDEYHYEEVLPCKCIGGWHKVAGSDRGIVFLRPNPSCTIHSRKTTNGNDVQDLEVQPES